MYVMATSCWGSKINKWSETSPDNRFRVIKAVLERQALPLALEAPNFTFAVEGCSRAAFDQMARTRVGAVFSAKGMRDNNWKDCSIIIPTALWREEFIGKAYTQLDQIIDLMVHVKNVYSDIVDLGLGSWQAARSVLPLYVAYGYSVNYNYMALKGVCANRMKFCEMEDTCAIAWLMQKAVSEEFPLLGSYLRPGCDFAGKCQYHTEYAMSEMFGCLFKECGRNKCEASSDYAEFNETCTNYKDLEEQLEVHITRPSEWKRYDCFGDLELEDRILIGKGWNFDV
jgi:thymidylate synthase ThyX